MIATVGVVFLALNIRMTAPLENQCRNNLLEIHQALQSYRADAGCLPPRVIYDAAGQPLHSWRVLLLPYVGGEHVVERYRFDEPWDSEHNRQLSDEMPTVYGCPASPEHQRYHTSYVAVVADGLSFDGQRASPSGPPDPTETIVVEMAPSEVHWMAPVDLSADEWARAVNDASGPSVSSFHKDKAHVLAADGTVRTLTAGERVAGPPPGP